MQVRRNTKCGPLADFGMCGRHETNVGRDMDGQGFLRGGHEFPKRGQSGPGVSGGGERRRTCT